MSITDTLEHVSKIVFLTALAFVLGWDTYAQLFGGTKATVSWAIWDWARKAPFIVFLFGFVMGHLFWGDPATMSQGPLITMVTVGWSAFIGKYAKRPGV